MLRRWPALLLIATLPAQTALDARVELAIKRGCRYLIKRQKEDGSLSGKYPRVGTHALSMLALLHSGVAKDDPVILKALRPLRGKSDQTYDISVRLMVIDLLREPALRGLARGDASTLVEGQNDDGGWSYRPANGRRHYDNSNTQYAILGLRAADKMGFPVARETWRHALQHVVAQQQRDGGVGYTLKSPSTCSMTAGSLSSMVVALARCDLDGSSKLVKRARQFQKRQLKFLERRWRPLVGGHDYYTMYGLERAMAFAGEEMLGDRDWYLEGAKVLVDAQKDDGSWNGNTVPTSFALLFLNRPTRPTAGETPGNVSAVMGSLNNQSRPADVQAAVGTLVARGKKIATLLVHYLENPCAPVREAAVLALRRLYGKRLGYEPLRSPRINAPAIAAWRKLVRK